MRIESKLAAAGLVLPAEPKLPHGEKLRFAWVRTRGTRVFLAGHGPVGDGEPVAPRGCVGEELSLEQGQVAARLAALSMLGSLSRALGDLDRITAWLSLTGYVRSAPGFYDTTAVLDGASDLILHLFGPEVGAHARTSVGVTALPLGLPVLLAGEVEIGE